MFKTYKAYLLACLLGTGCTVGESVNVEAEPGGAVAVTADGSRRIVSVDANALAMALATDETFRADVVASLTSVLESRFLDIESDIAELQGDIGENGTSISMNGSAIESISSAVAANGTAIGTQGDQLMSTRLDLDMNTSRLDAQESRLGAIERRIDSAIAVSPVANGGLLFEYAGTAPREVPDLNLSISTSGRPVWVELVSASDTTGQIGTDGFSLFSDRSARFLIQRLNGANWETIAAYQVKLSARGSVQQAPPLAAYAPASSVRFLDRSAPPGMNRYRLAVVSGRSEDSAVVDGIRLLAYEHYGPSI